MLERLNCLVRFAALAALGFVWVVSVPAMAGGAESVEAMSASRESPTVVYLARHAEKQTGSDPELTDEGRSRADHLAWILQREPLDAVLSTPFRRTMQTATAVAEAKGLEVIVTPIDGSAEEFVKSLAERIRRDHRGQRVLVVGHSNTVPETMDALGAQGVPRLTDQEYDDLWVVFMNSAEVPTWVRLSYSAGGE